MSSTAAEPRYGTLAWATANHGRMKRREQLRETAKAIAVLAGSAVPQARVRTGWQRPDALAVDLDSIVVPDSTIALEAEAECRESTPDHVLQHSVRTYFWGMLLARRDGLQPDPELLWVASLLHDLCLSGRHRHANAMPCFGARGGLLARDWAMARGYAEERATAVGDAISVHLNVSVGAEYPAESRLVGPAAALDVMGLRSWDVDRGTREAVVARYPRDHWLDTIADFRVESRPRTRAKLLRGLGLFTFAKYAPFETPG